MKTRVQRWGNSLALRIPKSFAIEVRLQSGAPVNMSIRDGTLVVAPVAEHKLTLDRLLSQVTRKNLHREVDTGRSVGKESW